LVSFYFRRGANRSLTGKHVGIGSKPSLPNIPAWLPFVGMTLCALIFMFIVNIITAGICGDGRDGDDCAPAVPIIHTLFVIVVGTCLAFGLGMLLGATNQSLGLQSSMLLQMVWGGVLLKGDIVANIIVAAVNNAVVAQSLSLLSDYRAGLLLKINPRVMFLTQLLGTAVGVLASTLSYMLVIHLSTNGTIDLNQSLWPNTGAQTTNMLAILFAKYGLGELFKYYPGLGTTWYVCLAIGITFPIIRRRIPQRPIFRNCPGWLTWQDIFPPIPILGIPFFIPYNLSSPPQSSLHSSTMSTSRTVTPTGT